MAAVSPASPNPPSPAGASLPVVRLEVRAGGTATSYSIGETGFLLGSVPGCDLRLSGAALPPVLALIARQPTGVSLRKLAPIGMLLLNGEAVTQAELNDGDQLSAGAVDIGISISKLPSPPSVPVMHVRLYDENADEERDVVLREREQTNDEERAALAVERHELSERAAQLQAQQEETERVQSEMTDIRRQLHERYRQRRDKLVAMQESVRRAARKVQERRQQLESDLEQARAFRGNEGSHENELRTLAGQLAEKSRQLEVQEISLRERRQQFEKELGRQRSELAEREQRLDEQRQQLNRSQTQHQTDLVRLDRLAATLEQRQRAMQKTALEVDRRYEGLSRDTRDLEEQAAQLDEWHENLKAKDEGLDRERKELATGRADLAARTAALEGQQAMFASLRTRLERMRDEHRRQEQQLDEQRTRQDEAEVEIQERLSTARRLEQGLQAEKLLREQQQKQFEERKATLEAAVSQLRQAQEKMAAEAAEFEQVRQAHEERVIQQQEQEALLEARLNEVEAEQERARADRRSIEERQANLARTEQVIGSLQEQLRKRSEDLAERQHALDEQARYSEEARTALEAERIELGQRHLKKDEEVAEARQALEKEKAELADTKADLEEREKGLRDEVQELILGKQQLAAERAEREAELARFAAERDKAAEETARVRAEVEAARAEGAALHEQLPLMETQAEVALERLALAREQLRGHLAEIHEYVRQGRADLESLRDSVVRDQQRLREQEAELHQARDVHRLAVAAFRQQLSEWQAQLAELKQSLAHGETRLERRLAEVEARARQIDAASEQLTQQAEQLEQQERQVVERRQEVDRHLSDMREWYRKKIRELSGIDADPAVADNVEHSLRECDATRGASCLHSPAQPDLLATGWPIEPGDRQLGELLSSLELIDADTLTALLGEARRQRRSLRQLLLQGGYLTLFQMALIEAGNLDGLVLGPVRVIDRLHATPHEAVYRIFDPRSEREALLRHLAESEMQDAVRPDEFRQRFASAVEVRHPNLAATWELLEIAGRPAVLQEWLTGLPSSEWPALAAVPGVWFRLVSQAAQGLHAAHQAGLTHGHLHPGQVVMTPEGVLKLCGLGEPSWLALPETELEEETDDLRALGRCALAWTMPSSDRKAKTKPLPDSLVTILKRLTGEEGHDPFPSIDALLQELESAGKSIPANAAAWDRFLRHVREQATDTPLRRSA
jgi:hypothetical protein